MIRNFSKRNLEKTLQIYDRNENKKTGQTQKEETDPKRSSKAPETIKVNANANDILGMQNLSMISYNNKKLQEKEALETKCKEETKTNSQSKAEAKEKTLEQIEPTNNLKINDNDKPENSKPKEEKVYNEDGSYSITKDNDIVEHYNADDTLHAIHDKKNETYTTYNEDGSYEVFGNSYTEYYNSDKKLYKKEDSDNNLIVLYDSNEKISSCLNTDNYTINYYNNGEFFLEVNLENEFRSDLISTLNWLDTSFGFTPIFEIFSDPSLKHLLNAVIDGAYNYADNKGFYIDDLKNIINNNLDKQYDEKEDILNDTFDRLLNRLNSWEDETVAQNGKIDSDFKQGSTGDCWLLATIKSITNNEQALKKLNDLISVDKNNNVIVKIQGKEYLVDNKTLNGAQELSKGDLDVRAIEIATEMYLREQAKVGDGNSINEGGSLNKGYDILFGKGVTVTPSELFVNVVGSQNEYLIDQNFVENIKSGNPLVTISTSNEGTNILAICEDGKTVKIESLHAYSLTNIDENYVYFVNPWDSSKILKLQYSDFTKAFDSASVNYLDGQIFKGLKINNNYNDNQNNWNNTNQPNKPDKNYFNNSNVTPNSNRNNNDVKPNNNNNVKPPLNGSNNTPSNNTTPNIDLSDIEMPETPGLNTNPEVKGIETTNENYSISGNINELFKDDVKKPEKQNSLNNKKFNESVENAKNKAIEDAYKKYGKDAEVTTDTKVTIDENGNFKVDINVTVKGVNVNGTNTGNGNNTNDTQGGQGNGNSNNNNGTTNTQGTQGNGNSGTNSNGSGKTETSLKKDIPSDATKLPDNAAANVRLHAGVNWVNNNDKFRDYNGEFRGDIFNTWVNKNIGKGQGKYWTGDTAQKVTEDLLDKGIDYIFENAHKYTEGGGCRKTAIDSNGYVLGSDPLGDRLRERLGIIDLTWNNEYYQQPPR